MVFEWRDFYIRAVLVTADCRSLCPFTGRCAAMRTAVPGQARRPAPEHVGEEPVIYHLAGRSVEGWVQ